MLPGTPFGDVSGFTDRYAPEGLIVYLEVAESGALAATSPVSWLVGVLKDPNVLVLKDDLVVIRVGLHWVECHGPTFLRPSGAGPVVKTSSIYVELAHERKVTPDTGHG
jgi:hypothetical protein